jgi:hypothetical protein
MRWLRDLFRALFGKATVLPPRPNIPAQPERLHCIRFMTERGEQIAVLLTTEEFERGLMRWVETVDTMPISMTEQDADERIG